MACYKRQLAKSVKWFYKFDRNGKTYFSHCIYKTKGEARKAEAQFLSELDKSKYVQNTITLDKAIKDRLDYLEQVKSEKYHADNKYYLDNFADTVGGCIPVCDITELNISSYLMEYSKELKIKNRKNYGVNAAIRCLKAFFNYTIRNNSLEIKNPVKSNFYPIDKRLKYIPPDSEIEAVLNICDAGQRQLVEFVRDTGCRIGEALKLTGNDVYDEFVVFYTRKSKNSNLTPRKVQRPECLNDLIIKDKEARIFKRWANTPDFLDEKVVLLNYKRWSWHNLRHRFASQLSRNNTPIFEIMAVLGHSSLTTTQLYLQLIP